ncbi:hypothetical protein ACSXEQ_12855 (plasmid) [Clostridium perfringens]|uniref:hypothetical protein n=1 Tax=Clostridium perfringens TaxID=1502 RepID=UPI00290E34B2|nr:hypothetical protein [Clostridium perfringens]
MFFNWCIDNKYLKQNLTIKIKRIKVSRKPKLERNNFAKRFLMSGWDIYTLSKLLGHNSVRVTESAYLDLTTTDIRKNYLKYSPLENMKNKNW